MPSDIEDVQAIDEAVELRKVNTHLRKQLHDAHARAEELIASVYEGARDAAISLGVPEAITPPTKTQPSKASPEVALWHLTDWQGGKQTVTYNSQVMAERVLLFIKKAAYLTDLQRKHHPVNEVVIAFGGDMVEGLFNFPTQVFEVDATLFDQWVTVSNLVAHTVLSALHLYKKVTVVSEWGNHGRIGSKRDSVPRADNLDRMVYHHARTVLVNQNRLTWEDSAEDIQHIEVGNYRALLIHGDEAGRNGFVSAQAMIQHVNRWKAGAHDWDFRDCYVGLYHRNDE